MPGDGLRWLRCYLWVVGAGLLGQGALTLVFLAFSEEGARRTHGVLNHDGRHGVLHVVWGLTLLALVSWEHRRRPLVTGAVVFGVFYLALAVLGMVTDDPFGLILGPGENGFHLIVGASALAVAVWATGTAPGAGLVARPNDG